MDYDWYVNECSRQLNDNKDCQKQTKDITNKIQERIRLYLIQVTCSTKTSKMKTHTSTSLSILNLKLAVSTSFQKFTKQEILAVRLYHVMDIQLNVFHNLSTSTETACTDASFLHERHDPPPSQTPGIRTSNRERNPRYA